MSKIHYIYQMNAFLEWRKRDHLSANTVLVYLTIFQTFNRDYWQHEWLPMSKLYPMSRTFFTFRSREHFFVLL